MSMDEKAKLEHLLGHWAEHNEAHAASYLEWAKKAESWGNAELGGVLKEIARDNKAAAEKFLKAKDLI